jgi:hypothetical protein
MAAAQPRHPAGADVGHARLLRVRFARRELKNSQTSARLSMGRIYDPSAPQGIPYVDVY